MEQHTHPDYLQLNKALWDERTAHHVDSDFYDMPGFMAGKTSLKEIELGLLGDVSGKSILHLQCHFGQDTLSLARMGAKVTGVDFSDVAIAKAKAVAGELKLDARFICSDVYKLHEQLDEQFDMIFTTYGVLGWLPSMEEWARVVSRFLKPGGTLMLVEFHPAVWMFDNDFTYVQYSYFNKEAIVENEQGTYTDKNAPIQLQSVGWNHPLSDVLTALLNNGMHIDAFREYDYSPYAAFSKSVPVGEDRFGIEGMAGKLPMVYAVKAVKKS